MGNNEESKSAKSEKSSSPTVPEQTNIHVYPDWGTMQAYYGPRVAIPPYYNSAMASGHTPHPYMWGPQPMMPPYGAPYAAVYSHAGIYSHPGFPLGSHPHATGVPTSPAGHSQVFQSNQFLLEQAATPVGVETPTKSTANTDRGLVKKLKGFDGLAMSIGNVNGTADNATGGEQRSSQSSQTEASTDRSDGNMAGGRKRSHDGSPTLGGDVKAEGQASSFALGEVSGPSSKTLGLTVTPATASGKSVLPSSVTPGMNTALELRNPTSVHAAKASPNCVPQSNVVLPSEAWLQNERELKRERRKQSNRESARRSRLRKQAETEELAHKVESLMAENVALRSEINQLEEKSEKLRVENSAMVGRLKNGQSGRPQDDGLSSLDEQNSTAVSTENLLSRVNNSACMDRNTEEEGNLYERNSKSGTKLHQLLDASPRADAVAAS